MDGSGHGIENIRGCALHNQAFVALEEAEVPSGRRPFSAHVRLLRFSGTMNHRCRAVDAEKSPFWQSRGKLHKNLTGPAANIERATRERADQAKRMFHEAIVDFAEVCVSSRRGVGLHLARIVHHLGFGKTRQTKIFSGPSHRGQHIVLR